jgi:hypothetical protein
VHTTVVALFNFFVMKHHCVIEWPLLFVFYYYGERRLTSFGTFVQSMYDSFRRNGTENQENETVADPKQQVVEDFTVVVVALTS